MLTFRPGYLVTVRPGGIGKYFKKTWLQKVYSIGFAVFHGKCKDNVLYFMGNARNKTDVPVESCLGNLLTQREHYLVLKEPDLEQRTENV